MDRVVFLSGSIPTPATVGYESLRNLIVRKVNGKEVREHENVDRSIRTERQANCIRSSSSKKTSRSISTTRSPTRWIRSFSSAASTVFRARSEAHGRGLLIRRMPIRRKRAFNSHTFARWTGDLRSLCRNDRAIVPARNLHLGRPNRSQVIHFTTLRAVLHASCVDWQTATPTMNILQRYQPFPGSRTRSVSSIGILWTALHPDRARPSMSPVTHGSFASIFPSFTKADLTLTVQDRVLQLTGGDSG